MPLLKLSVIAAKQATLFHILCVEILASTFAHRMGLSLVMLINLIAVAAKQCGQHKLSGQLIGVLSHTAILCRYMQDK